MWLTPAPPKTPPEELKAELNVEHEEEEDEEEEEDVGELIGAETFVSDEELARVHLDVDGLSCDISPVSQTDGKEV